MSGNDFSSSDDESDDDCTLSTRKFDLARKIESRFDTQSDDPLSSKWSFVMDDGMFERQANFSTPTDLWRHLQPIDASLTKLRLKNRKGTARLFKPGFSPLASKSLWEDSAIRNGGKWVIRFSRKFSMDISDFWVDVILAVVSDSMPRADLVSGCVFTTRKGKTEMEVWMKDDPTGVPPPSKKQITQLSEDELQVKMRELLGVAGDKTIQFQFKSHHADLQRKLDQEKQKKLDHETVKKVKQRISKKGKSWPLRASEKPVPQEEQTQIKKQKVNDCHKLLSADPYEPLTQPTQHYQYDQYDDEDEEVPQLDNAPLKPPPASALLSPYVPRLLEEEPTYPQEPMLSMETLQQMQMQGLCVVLSDDEEEVDLASLRTRLDSTDELAPILSPNVCRPDSWGCRPVPTHVRPTAKAVKAIDPAFEVNQLYSDGTEENSNDPLAFLDAQQIRPEPFKEEKFRKAHVLGTNPPDFSSPVMKAVLWPAKRRSSVSW